MALVSMTGYGRGEVVTKGLKVEVELSSVNRKQFDVRISMPNNLSGLDAKIKKLVHDSISRGSVTGVVRIGDANKGVGGKVSVDVDIAECYMRELRKAGRKLKVSDDISLRDLIRMPEVVKCGDITRDTTNIWPSLRTAFCQAVVALVNMRKSEGRELEKDINKRLITLKKILAVVEKQLPVAEKRFKSRLKKKLREVGLADKTADDKLQREIMFFIDKTDISEEMVRLVSHFKHAHKLLRENGPAGRAFDFLCQEMFREINTIASKANDTIISRQVVLFKTELECVREQVQNIE